MIDLAFQITFIVAYKLNYVCLSSSSGLESAILNFFFPSGRTVFPMCQLDRIFKDLSNNVGLLQDILFAV